MTKSTRSENLRHGVDGHWERVERKEVVFDGKGEASIFGNSGLIEVMACSMFGGLSTGLIQKGSFINGDR